MTGLMQWLKSETGRLCMASGVASGVTTTAVAAAGVANLIGLERLGVCVPAAGLMSATATMWYHQRWDMDTIKYNMGLNLLRPLLSEILKRSGAFSKDEEAYTAAAAVILMVHVPFMVLAYRKENTNAENLVRKRN